MEVPAAANEALSLVSTLRDLCRSVTQRIDNYRGNPQQLATLKKDLSSVEQKVDLCSETLQNYSQAIATETFKFELIDIRDMVRTLRDVDESVKKVEEALQRRRRNPFSEAFRKANRTAQDISEQVQVVRNISVRLNEMNEKLRAVATRNDVFRADFSSVPKFRMPVCLDFTTTNTMEGQVKAKLLERLQHSSPDTQDVHAHVTAVVGVSGMGGVGKTTALIGVAQDVDVRREFSDGGIHFLVVGKDASAGNLVASLKDMVRRSGGKRRCEDIDINGSVESAALTTSSWFAKRKALFICDDLWKTSTSETGYLNALVGLLDESPESHMLLSTRSREIASETNSSVLFAPRSNTGQESLGMFLSSANIDEATIEEIGCGDVVNEILEVCGGVPLMLSIAGAQIRRRSGTPGASLKGLIGALKGGRLSLPKKQPGQYPTCFNQAVQASLKTIADVLEGSEAFTSPWNEYSRNRGESSGRIGDFVIDLFQRLCVLPRSARVSEEIIFGIWCVRDKELGWNVIECLVDFHLVLEFTDSQGNSRFGVHDVIMDYCKRVSQGGGKVKYEIFHKEFVDEAWNVCHGELSSELDIENTRDDWNSDMKGYCDPKAWDRCRPWWKTLLSPVEEFSETREYLLGNVVRHLTESGRLGEAVGLVCHMGWTKVRVTHGGLSALKSDFSLVANCLELHCVKEDELKACEDTQQGIREIWDMVKKAWPVILTNSEALPTHAYGYLLGRENKLGLVERYLQSGEDIVSGPWFKPKSAFWHMLESSSDQRVFRIGEIVMDVALVKGEQMMLAATTRTLFWIETETMSAIRERVIRDENVSPSEICSFCVCEQRDILVIGFSTGELEVRNSRSGKLLKVISNAHKGRVCGVALTKDGRTIVSGSGDRTIRLWDVASRSPIGEPLYGHEDMVMSVAVSQEGRMVVSGSDDKTIRLWDAESGSAFGEPLRGHNGGVKSVAISKDGGTVVSGSDDMTIRLWDTESGSAIGEPLRGHEESVWSVAISEDGRRIVSGSRDNTVRLWDRESGSPIDGSLFRHEGGVWAVAMSKSGQTVVSVSGDKSNTVMECRE